MFIYPPLQEARIMARRAGRLDARITGTVLQTLTVGTGPRRVYMVVGAYSIVVRSEGFDAARIGRYTGRDKSAALADFQKRLRRI